MRRRIRDLDFGAIIDRIARSVNATTREVGDPGSRATLAFIATPADAVRRLRARIANAAASEVATPQELTFERPLVEAFVRLHHHPLATKELGHVHANHGPDMGPRLLEIANAHPEAAFDLSAVRQIRLQFGERVDTWIHALTNDGDHDRAAYLDRIAAAPETVKIVKLADLVENTASCSYAIVDMGVDWTEKTFLPIATEMRSVLLHAEFVEYPRAAALLREMLEYNFERLTRNIEMYRLAHDLEHAKPARQRNSGGPIPRISEEAWQRALERTRERERKEGERFKGPLFFVPTKDD